MVCLVLIMWPLKILWSISISLQGKMTNAAWLMLMLNALFLDYFYWNKEIEEKTYFRDSTVEAISNTDSLRVVHCHQNNDPTLPMQMMVALKLNSKIAPPDGFELINEPNVWLRQGYYQVFEFYSDFWEYFWKAPQEFLIRKILAEKLSMKNWCFSRTFCLMVLTRVCIANTMWIQKSRRSNH